MLLFFGFLRLCVSVFFCNGCVVVVVVVVVSCFCCFVLFLVFLNVVFLILLFLFISKTIEYIKTKHTHLVCLFV